MPLPEFTRVAWASASARAVWEPRIRAISAAWATVEVLSVAHKIRACALVFGMPSELFGLTAIEVAPGRFAIGRSRDVDVLAEAYRDHNDDLIGAMLGFPPCCRRFFYHVWNVAQRRDTTLSMEGTENGFREANILGRWLGVRCVPHLPCSWHCEDTRTFARLLDPLWPEQERVWRDEILSWRVKYSALHGIAIVTFPVVKVVTNTDYTAREHAIERAGASPVDAPSGLSFPFSNTREKNIITLASLRTDPREWTDNGFANRASMDAAHAAILDALRARESAGLEVLDLGCGNGALLGKIPAAVRVGVEADPERAARGRAAGRDVRTLRIQDVPGQLRETFGIALLSARRLDELSEPERRSLGAWLRAHVSEVLLYSYDEPRFTRLMPVSEV